MGITQVRVSDINGLPPPNGCELLRCKLLEHLDLPNGRPVWLEATWEEIKSAVEAAMEVVVLELHLPGDDQPRRVVVDRADFNALFTGQPVAELLATAEPVKSSKAINYATLGHAGTPHRGKITADEARIVREHLAEVNARLAAEGRKPIDPNNLRDAARYGFTIPGPNLPSSTDQ